MPATSVLESGLLAGLTVKTSWEKDPKETPSQSGFEMIPRCKSLTSLTSPNGIEEQIILLDCLAGLSSFLHDSLSIPSLSTL